MSPLPEMTPLVKGHAGRSVFTPGKRVRMNIVPMFLNVFVPWGVFVLCCGITSFWVMYAHPGVAWAAITTVLVLWLSLAGTALWARRYEPDPTWFSYSALMVLIMAIAGTLAGRSNFKSFSEHFYQIQDLKIVDRIDASYTRSSNLMDVGIFNFAPGNTLDETRSWHFKFRTLYCVAPILTNSTPPLSQTYDFWAVGKDCCSLAASDFRCGAWGSSGPAGGLRLTESDAGGDMAYYRLAVQQAESLYNIDAPNPIFVTWSSNPRAEVASWNQQVFKNFVTTVLFALVCSFFSMAMATCAYAFLGRARSAYAMDFYDDETWQQGGNRKAYDMSTRMYGA
mmetsp:Transcript_124084/g.356312  ORF Transcript_124084/g.356312 Transcript_124084/m.356312 type:complete len:338 (+) Transcript_124084:139-1152(+)